MTGPPQNLGNPFVVGAPIKDPANFYGRDEQVRSAIEHLLKRESTSFVGDHRGGKTSILYYLMNEVPYRRSGAPAEEFAFVYLNPQLGIDSPESFYRDLVEAIRRRFSAEPESAGDAASTRAVREALRALEPQRLVLMLDEFDALIGNKRFHVDFFEFLRGISGYHDVRFVTATTRPLSESYWGEWEGSPLYNVFPPPLHLGSWTEAEFDRFLQEASGRSEAPMADFRQAILVLAGRFPFYVQMACSLYLEEWRAHGRVAYQDESKVPRLFEEAASPHFERVWHRQLTVEERQALLALAHGQPAGDPRAEAKLVQRGYLLEDGIFSSAFRDYLLNQKPDVVPGTPVTGAKATQHTGLWIDRRSGEVWMEGELVAPPLTDLMYRLLVYLYEQAGCICDKYDIVEQVWGATYIKTVDDHRIAKLISRLRQRIEANPRQPRYLRTIHGRGYRLMVGGAET